MFYGTIKWNDTSIRYDQTKRIIEKFLADLKLNKDINFWLESCNVCASCCAIESVGGEFRFKLPQLNGKNITSYADMMFSYIYNIDTYKADGICDNEVQENLKKAINDISNCRARLLVNKDNDKLVESMKLEIKKKNAIVLSYTTNYGGGHYICLVGYDEDKNCFIGYDSWSNNQHCKNNGVLEVYENNFLIERIRNNSVIVVEGKK